MARLTPRFVPLSTAITAFVGSTVGFQPEIDPSSLTKMKKAGAEVPFFVTWKNAVVFLTCPVGLAPSLFRAAVGIVTTSERAVPSCMYSVETPVPLSLTQIVPPGDDTDMPQGLTRFASVCCATPAMSDWKFVHEYVSACADATVKIAAPKKSRQILVQVLIVFIVSLFS